MAAPNHFSSSALFPERPLMMVLVSFCEIWSFSFPAFLCWLRIASFLRFLCFFCRLVLSSNSFDFLKVKFSVTYPGWSWKSFLCIRALIHMKLFFLYFPVLCFT